MRHPFLCSAYGINEVTLYEFIAPKKEVFLGYYEIGKIK